MPAIGDTVFVNFPGNNNKRILHPCTVTQLSGNDSLTIQPENQELAFEVEQQFLLFFEKQRQFVQQPAKIEAQLEIESGTVLAVKTTGDPINAESRQCYRVNTLFSNLFATFDGEENCSLRDVSVTGFAVISSKQLDVGQVVDAELEFEGKRYTGQASIQSVCEQPDGTTRYGVNCVKQANGPTILNKGVQQISMAIQRQQLNRLAGGA